LDRNFRINIKGLHGSRNDLIGTQIRELPACSTVPQPITLPRAPKKNYTTLNTLMEMIAPFDKHGVRKHFNSHDGRECIFESTVLPQREIPM
jgi:hypothetical protein